MPLAPQRRHNQAVIIADPGNDRDTLQASLTDLGVEVEICEDFDCIQPILDAAVPDYIFLDLRLSKSDGIKVLETLSESRCNSRLFITGEQPQSVLDSACTIGLKLHLDVVGSLKRPFTGEQVRARLHSELDTRSRFSSEQFQEALGLGEFIIHYHPIIFLSPERETPIVGFEVRPHWRTKSGHKVWLSDLIGQIREQELLPSYNQMLMDKALESFSEWLKLGVDLGITLSMDKANLSDPNWPDLMLAIAEKWGVASNRITIAIEQQAMKGSPLTTLAVLTRLRIKEFKIAIDTMGTDIEELEKLLGVPFSELRLRRVLVNEIGHDMEAEFNVATLISLAKRNGIDTCAVGIRTAEAFSYLQDCGCSTATGSLFGESLPVNEVSRFIVDEMGLSLPDTRAENEIS